MNPRNTAILAVIALALGAFVYLYEIEGEGARQQALDEQERIFPGLDAGEIDAISLVTQDGTAARFMREESGWMLVSPVRAPADETAVEAIAAALAGLSRAGAVEAAGEPSQYGLGDSARRIRFEVGGGTRGLRIGRSTPVGGHLYVAPIGVEEISWVETYRLNPLNRDLADLRNRDILRLEPDAVEALSLAWPGGGVELERSESGDWRLVSPIAARADEESVRDLLVDLSYLQAAGFVDEESEAVVAALSESALDVRLGLGNETRRVSIGGLWNGDRLVRGPDGRLFTLTAERLEDFPKTVSDYRFRTLSSFEVDRARRLELRFAATAKDAPERVVARLEGSGWTSEDVALDADRTAELVRELSLLRADSIVADEMGPEELASLGLEPPRVRLRVDAGEGDGEAGEALAELSVGRLDLGRGIHVRRADEPTVYLLPAERVDTIPISWQVFAGRYVAQPEAPAEAGAGQAEPPEAPLEDLYPGLLEDPHDSHEH